MTLKSDAGAIAHPSGPHAHDHGDHHADHAGQAHDAALPRLRFSPFLSSALDRLGLAVILSGLVWIGVVWAVR